MANDGDDVQVDDELRDSATTVPERTGPVIDPAQSAVVLIAYIATRIGATSMRIFGERHGLTTAEWRIIATVAAEPGRSGRQIAERTGIDPAAVSRGVRSCADRGLLIINADQRQRNYQRIWLSGAGKQLHDDALSTAVEREEALLGAFDSDEQRIFMEMLRRVLAQCDHLPGA